MKIFNSKLPNSKLSIAAPSAIGALAATAAFALSAFALLAPAASAQTSFSAAYPSIVTGGAIGAGMYAYITQSPDGTLTAGGNSYNSQSEFTFTDPLLSSLGTDPFNFDAETSGNPFTTLGTLSGDFTSGSYSNGAYTEDMDITSGTGVFAGDTGTGVATFPDFTPGETMGVSNVSVSGTLRPAATAVPEPSSFTLLGLGLLPLALLARRKMAGG